MWWWISRLPTLFFFNDTATTEIYPLSLHDALPISQPHSTPSPTSTALASSIRATMWNGVGGSEEHTSELQSRQYLVCRLLLEKKKNPYLHTSLPSHCLYSKGAGVGKSLRVCLVLSA